MAELISICLTSISVINKFGYVSSELPDIFFNLSVYLRTNKYIEELYTDSTQSARKNTINITKGKVKFDKVGIKYGDKKVFDNFNLDISPTQCVIILGKIGCGKSSLAKSLIKMNKISSGKIFIDDIDIEDINPQSLRKNIIYIKQNPIPFNRTLFENIIYGNEDKTDRKQVEALLDKYNLKSFFNHDLDKSVGRKGQMLSGGQRQLIFLLRILLSDKKILILDEPTSSLDSKSRDHIVNIIKDLKKNKTVIIITHDESIVSIGDKVVRL